MDNWKYETEVLATAGAEFKIDTIIIDSGKPGHTVCGVATIHGNEPEGSAIFRGLLFGSDPALQSGRVCLIPSVNPAGRSRGIREFPWKGKKYDLNRYFPGDASGAAPQQLAHLVYKTITGWKPVIVLDWHAWGRSEVFALLDRPATKVGIETLARTIGYAKKSGVVVCQEIGGLEYIESHRDHALTNALISDGIPAFTIECGPIGYISNQHIQYGVSIWHNILRHFGMIGDKEVWSPVRSRIKRIKTDDVLQLHEIRYHGKRRGHIRYVTQVGEKVTDGGMIALVEDEKWKDVAVIKSSGNGYVIALEECDVVENGDLVAAVGVFDK